MYKLEIGVFEEDKYIYQLDEDGFICRDENLDPIILGKRTRKFITIISEMLSTDDAAAKVRLLLRSELAKWDNNKILSVFGHTESDPKTMLMDENFGYPKTMLMDENFGFRVYKVD